MSANETTLHPRVKIALDHHPFLSLTCNLYQIYFTNDNETRMNTHKYAMIRIWLVNLFRVGHEMYKLTQHTYKLKHMHNSIDKQNA